MAEPNNNKVVLDSYTPCVAEVEKYILKWNELEDYVNQENSLDTLFMELCKDNHLIDYILIKCSVLNDFYSTNIFKIHNVAKHYMNQNIDARLAKGDLTLVKDLTTIKINGKEHKFYSFATKYCSHHRPDVYPIYDKYVHKVLVYFRNRDKFYEFKGANLKDYETYNKVILEFRKYYGLEQYNVKELDKYLWQFGKEHLY